MASGVIYNNGFCVGIVSKMDPETSFWVIAAAALEMFREFHVLTVEVSGVFVAESAGASGRDMRVVFPSGSFGFLLKINTVTE